MGEVDRRDVASGVRACCGAVMLISMAETQRGCPGDAPQEEAATRAQSVVAVASVGVGRAAEARAPHGRKE